MNKLSLACVGVCFAALSATAMAGSDSPPPTSRAHKGNDGCVAPLFTPKLFDNPGKWFQAWKEQAGPVTGKAVEPNPHEWSEIIAAPVDEGGYGNPLGVDNLGELVVVGCGML